MKKNLTSDIIVSVTMIVLGLFLLLYGQSMMDLVVILLGVSIILYGVFNLVTYFRYRLIYNPVSNLVYGIVGSVFGVILALNPRIISDIISFIVGAYILLISIPSLIDAIRFKVNSIAIGLSIAGIVIGVLCLVGKLVISQIIFQFLGLMLIVFGIINIINMILLDQGMKLKDSNENQIIKK